MVNPDVPQDFDGCAFRCGLENDRSFDIYNQFRNKFYFLPSATAEECVTYYRGELDARGTIWRQIRKMKIASQKRNQAEGEEGDSNLEGISSGDEAQDGTAGEQLPGLVWPKYDDDWYYIDYRDWFFMYPHADVQWSADDNNRKITSSDLSLSLGEDEVVKFDPIEHPIHSGRMSARDREGYIEGAVGWMVNRKNSNWELASRGHVRC